MSSIRSAINFLHSDFKIFGSFGSVYYRGANNNLTELLVGTAGQQLAISAGGVPVWVTPATLTIGDKSVTLPKIQDIPSGSILGRATGGSGNPELLAGVQVAAILGLGNAATKAVGSAVGNLPDIKSDGKLDPLIIPPIAIGSGQLVATNAAKLALTGLVAGETLVRVTTDETRGSKGSAYIYIGGTTSNETSWLLLSDERVDAGDIVSGTIDLARLPPITPVLPLSVSTASIDLVADSRYYANGVAKLIYTLPSISAVGTRIEVTDISGLSFRIAQKAGHTIRFLDAITVAGVTGYIEPTADSPYASVAIECITANSQWQVINPLGNFTLAN
jgi:hypothetical protein